MDKKDLHLLRLMGEIDRDGDHSQRELSRRLNISLGLVNTFLKRLVNKGYFKVKTMPRNRAKYFLTPEGLTRKSKLTVEYLQYSLNFYKDIKTLLLNRYKDMDKKNVKSVLFYGAGEVAELAYLYLQQTDIRLIGIIDDQQTGKNFFDFRIDSIDGLKQMDWDMVLLTRLEDMDQDIKTLLKRGIDSEKITTI
ncbi:MAG: winged helix-turn-helix transcriptional regulator [Desulfatiglandales bacterium]|nr:winged helix-turn-helix transcriptional regulator [Desulfatiglandales bacterium]